MQVHTSGVVYIVSSSMECVIPACVCVCEMISIVVSFSLASLAGTAELKLYKDRFDDANFAESINGTTW